MKLKIKDFAEKYEIARQSAYRLIKEGTLIADKDNLLDENLSTNRYWIESRTMHLQEQSEEQTLPEQAENSEPDTLKSLKIQNLRLDAEYKKLRNDEKSRKLIPMDVTQLIFQNMSRHLIFGFLNFSENTFLSTCTSLDVPHAQMVALRSSMQREIERLGKEAKDLTHRDLKAYLESQENN